MHSHIEKLYIIGFGTSGREFAAELGSNSEGITADITIVDADDKSAGIQRDLSAAFHFLPFSQLTASILNGAVVVVAVPPAAMHVCLLMLSESNCSSIIIEKPGPIPFQDSQPVLADIERRGAKLYVSHQRQYADHFNIVTQAIAKSKIGRADVCVVSLEKWDFLTGGTHWMALCHACFGLPIEAFGFVRYCGEKSAKYAYDIERDGMFTVRHASGTPVVWRLGGGGNRSDFRVLGANGYIDLKVKEQPLGSICTGVHVEELLSYGAARARLCLAAYRGEAPKVGCAIGDLEVYLRLFQGLTRIPSV